MDFGELLNELALSLNALHRTDVCGQGETLSECFILSTVPDGGVHMSSLSGKLGVDNSTLTRLIGNLERKGYAFRQRDEGDKRLVYVFLTAAGRELLSIFSERLELLGERIQNDLPAEKREEIKNALETLLWSLSRELLKAS